jgi:class 3 adenylate cyclase/tetratricopeptide (TPR) repeat protein
MKCPKCQFDNPEGAKFCNECGNKLELACPECGKANPLGSKFCNECGHNLKEAKEAPSIDYNKPQSYTPKFLANKILTTRSSIKGERKIVTILFADIANYTSISEKLDPEEVHQIMDGCFKILMEEVHKYEGTINQFTGDGIMALFGAPLSHEDHAQRACHAALSIQKSLKGYGDELENKAGLDFKMRVGLNSGPVVVGSIGDDLRMDYTAIGDSTNLASRMESTARPGTILVSENVHKIARDFFEFESLGKVQVKGKEQPLEAYELIKVSKVESRIGAAVAKGLTKFVGREEEIDILKKAFEKAKSGSGQVVGIVGEAGVGKTRLKLELIGMLPKDEHIYLEGICLHFGESMPYLPILDILRSYFDVKEGDREYIVKKKMEEKVSQNDEAFKNVLPPFHDLLSIKVEDEDYLNLEPKQKRERIFEAIRDLFIRESQKKSLVLVIDDLEWIDKTSEEFLDYLIGWLPGTHILLIILYRPEYTHQWGSKSYYSKIGVDQLSGNTSTELVSAILKEAEAIPELMELIISRTGGNPLFTEEFTRSLLENGSIEKKEHQYVLSTKVSEIQVPDTIQGIIAARMDRLEDNLKHIMQVASVIGRDFGFRILQTVIGMQKELKHYLLSLQGLGFVYEKTLFPELQYIFKHALTQEVAYNSLLLKRRKEIHQEIGKAIEEIYPEKLEEFYEMLAYHYSKSDDSEKAYEYLWLSGEKASRSNSTWETFGYCKEAINVLTHLPETDENKRKKLEVLRLMTGPMRLLGYPEGSLKFLKEGEKLAKEMGDEKSQAILYSRMGHYFTIKGANPLLGIEYSEISFKIAEKMKDIELIARTSWDLTASYNISGQFLNSINVAEKVISLLEKTKKELEYFGAGLNVYSVLLAYYGMCMGLMGNFEKGKVFLEKGLRFASEINDRTGAGPVEWHYSMFFCAKGDGENAIDHFRKGIRYIEEVKYISILGLAWSGLGWGHYLIGDLETARKYIEKGLKIQRDAGVPWWLSLHFLLLGMVHFGSGDLQKRSKLYAGGRNTITQE